MKIQQLNPFVLYKYSASLIGDSTIFRLRVQHFPELKARYSKEGGFRDDHIKVPGHQVKEPGHPCKAQTPAFYSLIKWLTIDGMEIHPVIDIKPN